jgi:hypothetical protein
MSRQLIAKLTTLAAPDTEQQAQMTSPVVFVTQIILRLKNGRFSGDSG